MFQRGLHAMRGTAVPETAVVVSFVLVLFFGMFQIVTIGFLQVAGDAGTFLAAHEFTLGVDPNAIATMESTMVPRIIATAIQYTPAPPPSVDPNLFASIYGSFPLNNNQRNSGWTTVRPQNFQVFVNQNSANGSVATYQGILGFSNIPIDSGAVEGFYLMTQNEMDNFGVDPNSGLTGNILNNANAGPFLPQSDQTVANMNTPPYYLPNPIMEICSSPWNGSGGSFSDACSNSYVWYLGLAEYLSNTNYAPGTLQMGVGAGQVFNAMGIHQRVYASLVNAFPPLVAGGTYATQDAVLAAIQARFQDYTGSLGGASVGALWTPPPANFNNGGATGSNVAIGYYDIMRWWNIGSGAGKTTLWVPHAMWQNESSLGMTLDAGTDAYLGPSAWNNNALSTLYVWDQPNFPALGKNPGPGSYPTSPLAGGSAAGDPAY
jgi:hypothetical protein